MRATIAGVIMGTVLIGAANTSVAQDKGKDRSGRTRKGVAGRPAAAVRQCAAGEDDRATALAVLVFPKVTKAGLGIGGQYGEGTLLKKGTAVAYYKTTGASIGLQAGGQTYGYAMFFMNQKSLDEFVNASRLRGRRRPEHRVVDEGMGKSTTTTTLKGDIYAFVFGQKGLMAGLGIQGNKITKITPK